MVLFRGADQQPIGVAKPAVRMAATGGDGHGSSSSWRTTEGELTASSSDRQDRDVQLVAGDKRCDLIAFLEHARQL
jgi:hypothetical protein